MLKLVKLDNMTKMSRENYLGSASQIFLNFHPNKSVLFIEFSSLLSVLSNLMP